MRKFFTIVAQSALALLTLMIAAIFAITSYLTWHYTYGLGLPDNKRLAAIAATGPACPEESKPTYVPLGEIPPLLRKAVILFEQPDYYERPTLSPFADIAYAFTHSRKLRASHITNSVTRCLMSLADCCRGPGLDWHVGNLVLQTRVVRTLSRDRILEIFLNESYFGRGSHGVGAASISYFGKPPDLLSIHEIALIAVLPRSPWLQDGRALERAVERRNTVIDKMLQAGLINNADATSARAQSLEFRDLPPKTQLQ